jgi:hypothetical protein
MTIKCYIGILYFVGMIRRMMVVLGYSEVFNQPPPEDYLEFFTKYPTRNILIKMAQINAILFNRQPDSDYQVVQEVFYQQKEITDQMLALLIKTNCHGNYFVAPSLSMLTKYALNHQQDFEYDNQSDHDFMSELLKTILIFNQTYNEQINGTEDLISFRSVFTLVSLQQSYIRTTKLPVYIIKSIDLEDI